MYLSDRYGEENGMQRRLIACGGMNRSGSTWQFNAVRELIKAADPSLDIYSCWIGEYDESQPADVHIVKIHALSQLGPHVADTILTSYRDLRAVAGSLVRMRWVPPESSLICAFLDGYVTREAILRAAAHYQMSYEIMVALPVKVLGDVANVLKLDLTPEEIILAHKRICSITPQAGEPSGKIFDFDVNTQLHRGHIGGILNKDSASFLTPAIEADINLRFAAWLLDHGYSAWQCG